MTSDPAKGGPAAPSGAASVMVFMMPPSWATVTSMGSLAMVFFVTKLVGEEEEMELLEVQDMRFEMEQCDGCVAKKSTGKKARSSKICHRRARRTAVNEADRRLYIVVGTNYQQLRTTRSI